MFASILAFTLIAQTSLSVTNTNGDWFIRLPENPPNINIEYKLNHQQNEVYGHKVIAEGYRLSVNSSNLWRCICRFFYSKGTLIIQHDHDVRSDEVYRGVLTIKYGEKRYQVNFDDLKEGKKPLRQLSDNWKDMLTDAAPKYNLVGVRGSSDKAFVIGRCIDDDAIWTLGSFSIPDQLITPGSTVKVEFDYLSDKLGINPICFEVFTKDYTNDRSTFSFKPLKTWILPIDKCERWRHFSAFIKTNPSSAYINFRWRINPLEKDGIQYGVGIIDNLKLNVVGVKEITP